jgi:hypothetical protein
MLKRAERPLRVLCYADMDSLIPYCVAAAEILRSKMNAHVMMMVYDRNLMHHKAFENYDLFDHRILFQRSRKYNPVEQVRTAAPPGAETEDASSTASLNAENIARTAVANPGAVDASSETGVVVQARRRNELGDLRKVLARSKIIKGTRYRIRSIPYWLLYFYRRVKYVLTRFRSVRSVVQVVRALRRGMHVKQFLQVMQPDLIILAEDNIERLSMTLVNEGHRQGIPSIVLPYTIPNPLEPAKSYRDCRSYQVRTPLARLVGKIFPKWQFEIDGRKLLRMPAATALILEWLGQSSPAPWVLNRGASAKIALDSEAQRRAYLDLGFPEEQLSVVGDIHGGVLHRALTDRVQLLPKLLSRYDLCPGRPLILCAFPPDQLTSKAAEFEFESYDALISGWIESFRQLGDRANILVRPHPRIPLERFAAIQVPNVRFTDEPTVGLVPLCDLYVASISATIRWALACGIPVINYDTYRYRYGDYDKAPGIIQTETLADFRTQLARFVDDPKFAAEIMRCQQGAMKDWGMIDDRLPERFAALASELTGVGVQTGTT